MDNDRIRPGQAAIFAPVNGDPDVSVGLPIVCWHAVRGETYDVYFGTDPDCLDQIAAGVLDSIAAVPGDGFLGYGQTYYWRVDAINEHGTTIGDVWSFTTEATDISYRLLPGGSGLGRFDGGIEGIDWELTDLGRLSISKDTIIVDGNAVYMQIEVM